MNRSFWVCVLVALCGMAQGQGTDHVLKSKGLLWEISGNGLPRPGYVYGTMHVPEKLAFNLSDSFFVAIRSVDVVGLETDHASWLDFSDSLGEESYGTIFQMQNQRQDGDFDDFYGEGLAFSAPDSRMLSQMFSLRPLMTNEIFNRSSSSRQDFEEDTYLDQFIFQSGKKLGKTVIGLETLESSLSSSLRSRFPDKDDKKVRYDSRQYISTEAFRDAYRKQDLELLDSLDRIANPSKNFRKWMLDERNVVMANRFDSLMRAGSTVFAGVGASHLPGEMGVLNLLRQKGYQVRAVTFTDNGAKKEITKMQELRVPVKMVGHWAPDSLWYAEVPGKFYKTRNFKAGEEFLCADMSNGAYYAVHQINTYGLWSGLTQAEIALRIDSLVYEKVPGKIQERKTLTEPFPGHEITTKLRRGDIKKYRIFVTPNEVLYFTVTGNGDYANGEEAQQFLNSIKFNPKRFVPAAGSETLKPAEGGFKVTFPARLLKNTTADPKASNYFATALDPTDSSFYMMARIEYHDFDFIEEDTFELNVFTEELAKTYTDSLPTYRLLSESPYPTQEFSFRGDRDSAYYFGRIVIDGPRYYLLGCRRRENKVPKAFLESFEILPFSYTEQWYTEVDTTHKFEVKTMYSSVEHQSEVSKRLELIIKEGQELARDEEEGYYNRNKNWRTNFTSALTGEYVGVYSSEVKNGLYRNSLDSLKADMRKWIAEESSQKIESESWDFNPEKTKIVLDIVVTDTNTTRAIKRRAIMTQKRLYWLITDINLQKPASEFINQVFNTFQPTDSIHEQIEFGTVDVSFLTRLYDADTVVRKDAWKEFDKFESEGYQPQHFQYLQAAIDHPEFKNLKLRKKRSLLRELSFFEEPEFVPYIASLLDRYADSMLIQSQILNVLSRIKTKEAYNLLFKKWSTTPVYLDEPDALFDNLADSLELTHKFLKQLNIIARNDHYIDEVVTLYADMLHVGIIKPSAYKSIVPHLDQECRHELLQQKAIAEEKAQKDDDENNYYYRSYANENSDEEGLQDAISLLIPYMNSHDEVKKLIYQFADVSNDELKCDIYALMLKNGQYVAPDSINRLANYDKARWTLFRDLIEANHIAQYRNLFTDTVALARSYLYRRMSQLDTVNFISRHKTILRGDAAILFFFEVKEKEEEKYKLAHVTLPLSLFREQTNAEASSRDDEQMYRYRGPEFDTFRFNSDKEKEDYIKNKLGELRFNNRKRHVKQREYEYFDNADEY